MRETAIDRREEKERESGRTGRSANRSQNADEGFYCIGQDIKVRVTSVHTREIARSWSPLLAVRVHRFALALALALARFTTE